MKYSIILLLSLCGIIASCGDDKENPKPSTYFRTDLPDHSYKKITNSSKYAYELSDLFSVKEVSVRGERTDHQEISLGKLDGLLYLNYYPTPNRDSLIRYINLSNDKVDEHQVKASKILDKTFIFPKKKVYCTFFELQGNVATNFQFYITDSSTRFVRGELLMNCRPNYDSLRPVLNYIQKDLEHMIETFEWK
jgi:gliding motility-associated lipoprotein GldD